MQRTHGARGFVRVREVPQQRGQALIYGLFVLIGGSVALFFLFNTGQLTREKTKLVNTADAVAYSAGVMHARGLNFAAYTNRAMMANSVAIAQLVSLASWIQYVDKFGSVGAAVVDTLRYPHVYWPSYLPASMLGPSLQSDLNDSHALEQLASASDGIVRDALMVAQRVAQQQMASARVQVMNEVAAANYRNDGTVTVDRVTLGTPDYADFVQGYSGDDRARFAAATKIAANRDRFVPARSWRADATFPMCTSALLFGRTDWLDRRGGTELIGFDEWKAIDTLSEKRWVPKNKYDVACRGLSEIPTGWGGQTAADNASIDLDPSHHDWSLATNPASTGLAMVTSSSWGYSGLPNFYDLSIDTLNQDDPRLNFAIRLRRDQSQTVTSEGRSAVRATARLNAYQAQPAGGSALVAVSASEVYFERPDDVRSNGYGSAVLGRPREIGSLFNPFWQVHLIQSDAGISAARALQGIGSP